MFLFFLYFISRCVELIIYEQMNKYKARLKDINTLEFAENKAKSRLTFIRRSMVSKIKTQQMVPRDPTSHDTHLHFNPEFVLCRTPLTLFLHIPSALQSRDL